MKANMMHKKRVPQKYSRREFFVPLLASGLAIGNINLLGMADIRTGNTPPTRRFHACVSLQGWEANPDRPRILKNAGVTDIWMGAYFYGKWYRKPEELRKMAEFLENKGFNVHIINLPLGHPGDAIRMDENTDPLATPPNHWKNYCTSNGQLYSGTSIHAPAVEENRKAMIELQKSGFDAVFLDDDFRVARMPGHIGGCFCDVCRDEFLEAYGYNNGHWKQLIESVENRKPDQVLQSWIAYICDKETHMFNVLKDAVPEMQVGIMVMYLGAEKAGIALDKYRDVPFRVGEFMFDDKTFGVIKGKTDELFSVLFHRRFTAPDLAYSETTAYPKDALSAKNMAAKLSVSLIADVRNTMFMNGLVTFPDGYWELLKPAMQKSAKLHEAIAGHKPAGPFKHFWGWDSRIVGRDKPFSLFLASGIPFEVTEELSADGWTFLSDEDALAVEEGRLKAAEKNLVVRNRAKVSGDHFIPIEEEISDVMRFKKQVIPALKETPYVDGEIPAVFAWYPTANKALIWNVQETKQAFQIKREGQLLQTVTVGGLDVELISDLNN
jgi:hypothetical protein